MRYLPTTFGIKQFLFIFFATLTQYLVIAQEADFNFINFSNKDGLSSNSVNTIIKDKFGYMWFGTDDGLNRFDGANFTVYRHKAGDTNSIGGNGILSLVEDNSGNLWVGTERTVSFYDRRRDAFINYDFVKNVAARALAIDHLGILWVGTYGGLYQFDQVKGVLKYYSHNPGKASQLISNTIVNIFEDSQHRLWVGTTAGAHLYIRGKDSFITYLHAPGDPASIAGNTVLSITEDANGSLWFATDGGISKLMPGASHFKSYRHNGATNSLSSGKVRMVAPDQAGVLWIGTETGLNILDEATGKIRRIDNDPRNKYSLAGKTVRSIYIDKNGTYWIGTFRNGVNKYDKNLAFFNLRQSNPLDPSGLSGPIVTSFAEDPYGNLYVGTDGGGLNLFNRKTGLFAHPVLTSDKGKPLSILAMEKMGNQLLIATYQQGLYVLNMISGAVKHYLSGKGRNDLSGNEIFCIKKDREGKVWIGLNGQGVNIFDPATGTFQRFEENSIPADVRLLTGGYIRTIEEDKSGNIWIGSHGGGIALYDRASDSFRILNQYNSKLSMNNILNIYSDRNDNTWVGTAGGGLNLFDKNKNSFVSFSEEDGLSNAVIYKIIEDDNGKLWLSTNKGLSSFDEKKRRFKNYSFQNGLQRSTFCLGAGIKTSTGELFFGGVEGFNYFDPKSLRCNKNIPALAFTDLKISNRSVNPGERSPIKEHVSIADEIRLDYKQNFSLEFAALNYTSPLENRYSYKLDGFDKEWNEVGSLRTASYMNLDPGVYTFRVRAKSDDGLWSTPEKTIRIYVKPPFWRTIYAYIFYVIATVLLVALIRYRGIRNLKKKFALEQERLQFQKMIEEEKREREREHEFDQLKIKFLTNLSHEFRTPISLIVGPVEKMADTETGSEKREQLNLVKRNARRLLNLVNQLLDFRKLENNELKINCTAGDLVSFTRDIADSFKDMSDNKDIRFSFSSSLAHCYTFFDKDKIERILFNLLSNAFKFTERGGSISVAVEPGSGSKLKIIVSDTGVGMTTEEKSKIFDRFFQGEVSADILNQGSGIGLSITKEFVKLHGGDINVSSEPGKGSVFTVFLPYELIPPVVEEIPSPSGSVVSLPTMTEEIPGPEKLTVLLIEDNDDFRNYLRDNLKSSYKIVEACNGKEGWQKALSAHPKVIVSDISMPGMDGVTLSRKLKSDKRTSHIPVILLTALTGDANQLTGLQTGANDYLTKPFNFDILHIKIRNLLALNRSFESTYSRQFKITSSPIEMQSPDQQLLQKITAYIEANIDNPNLSVEELSKHVFLTRGSLYNKIVALAGETPVEFIRSIKLQKAICLLEKNSDMKIAEIAYAAGFTTANYFTRAFKAKFNVSPTEYINIKKKEAAVGNPPSKIIST